MAFVFGHNRKRKNILFCSVTLFLHLQNLLYLRLKSPQAFLPFRFNFVCFRRLLPLGVYYTPSERNRQILHQIRSPFGFRIWEYAHFVRVI